MAHCCEVAVQQIQDRGYAIRLDGYREVLAYGVAFYHKSALVKKANVSNIG
jgi:hypothetical protein